MIKNIEKINNPYQVSYKQGSCPRQWTLPIMTSNTKKNVRLVNKKPIREERTIVMKAISPYTEK